MQKFYRDVIIQATIYPVNIFYYKLMCLGLKDEAAIHKKTDTPSAASMDGFDKDGDMNRGTKTVPSSSSATDAGASRRKGRGKSSLNADAVSSPFMLA